MAKDKSDASILSLSDIMNIQLKESEEEKLRKRKQLEYKKEQSKEKTLFSLFQHKNGYII